MIPDAKFKMKRSTKIVMALMKGSKEDRNHFKHMMIDAQLYEEAAIRANLKSKEKTLFGSRDKEVVPNP